MRFKSNGWVNGLHHLHFTWHENGENVNEMAGSRWEITFEWQFIVISFNGQADYSFIYWFMHNKPTNHITTQFFTGIQLNIPIDWCSNKRKSSVESQTVEYFHSSDQWDGRNSNGAIKRNHINLRINNRGIDSHKTFNGFSCLKLIGRVLHSHQLLPQYVCVCVCVCLRLDER